MTTPDAVAVIERNALDAAKDKSEVAIAAAQTAKTSERCQCFCSPLHKHCGEAYYSIAIKRNQ